MIEAFLQHDYRRSHNQPYPLILKENGVDLRLIFCLGVSKEMGRHCRGTDGRGCLRARYDPSRQRLAFLQMRRKRG